MSVHVSDPEMMVQMAIVMISTKLHSHRPSTRGSKHSSILFHIIAPTSIYSIYVKYLSVPDTIF